MRIAPRSATLLALGLAACTTTTSPPPRPATPPPARKVPLPAPVAPKPVPTAPADWRDVPLTPGRWVYAQDAAGSSASYGPATGAPLFVMRCDRAARRVTLSRMGPNGGNLTIRTSSSTQTVLPRVARPGRVDIGFSATDSFLDQIAFSRGRFTVESPGVPALVLPAWAEPARVIEDCRI